MNLVSLEKKEESKDLFIPAIQQEEARGTAQRRKFFHTSNDEQLAVVVSSLAKVCIVDLHLLQLPSDKMTSYPHSSIPT